jgi:hypothetical protein
MDTFSLIQDFIMRQFMEKLKFTEITSKPSRSKINLKFSVFMKMLTSVTRRTILLNVLRPFLASSQESKAVLVA